MSQLKINEDYKNWLINLKSKIKNSQIKAALSVNSELIALYWEIGAMIVEKQENAKWGSAFIEQTAKDLKTEFPDLTGFSQRNLYSMRRFYLFYNQKDKIIYNLDRQLENPTNEILHQPGAKLESGSNTIFHQVGAKLENNKNLQILTQIPWRHNVVIVQKSKDIKEAFFYIRETIKNNWSRAVLEYQIETDLYNRQGKAINNFNNTLPQHDSDLAQQLLKDPYNFDFLTLTKRAKEKDLEQQLIVHISQFLTELGKGFAYMGRQYLLKVGESEFRTDLLFYHTILRAYIVIELKMTKFEPEFAGKLNFYITAINELVKTEHDKPTIGILLCKSKDDIVVDFALKDINKPIGVSEFTYNQLPEEIKKYLPSEQEFKDELNKLNDEQNKK